MEYLTINLRTFMSELDFCNALVKEIVYVFVSEWVSEIIKPIFYLFMHYHTGVPHVCIYAYMCVCVGGGV